MAVSKKFNFDESADSLLFLDGVSETFPVDSAVALRFGRGTAITSCFTSLSTSSTGFFCEKSFVGSGEIFGSVLGVFSIDFGMSMDVDKSMFFPSLSHCSMPNAEANVASSIVSAV